MIEFDQTKSGDFNHITCKKLTGYSFDEFLSLTGIDGCPNSNDQIIIEEGVYPSMTIYISNSLVTLQRVIDLELRIIQNIRFVCHHPQNGIGLSIFKSQLEAAKRFKFKMLSCEASREDYDRYLYVGYVVWAKFGYVMTPYYQKKFDKFIELYNRQEPTLHQLLYSKRITEINGVKKDGFLLWKEYGESWDGEFQLDNPVCVEIFKNYTESKSAKSKIVS